jgi:putative radical SAM enzyme (TIGR03279 family)
MSSPVVTSVEPGSPAELAGVRVGDEIVAIDGRVPADVLEYRWLVDEADPELELVRGGLATTVVVPKPAGATLGVEVHSAVFDRVMTCDNHCEFCFIHQLPPDTRRSLHLKDDDYRLSFLYGNFTTLTRFTEADFERVLTEGLSPLHVSLHTTNPLARAEMLRNRRGAVSLRWLRALLDAGVEVHGQVVVCPGVNDGDVLVDTLTGILDEYPDLASVCVVPLGVSRFNGEARMRPHTPEEAAAVIDAVEAAQADFAAVLGRRVAFAADEYYLLAGRAFPPADSYEGFPMHEDGVGMAAAFASEFAGASAPRGPASGFFAAVDGAPAAGYRALRTTAPTSSGVPGPVPVTLAPRRDLPVTILSGEYGAAVLRPILDAAGYADVEVLAVPNQFFGGTTAVTGLLTGSDLTLVLDGRDERRRYLLPDVCLSGGRFLDDTTPDDLPVPVEIIPTDGASLRAALARPGLRA